MTQSILGIDVGGTFTDLYLGGEAEAGVRVLKVPSTPADPAQGLIDALDASQVPAEAVGIILHGTTIATNAIIERRGATTALVTTKGFRDVLELGRRDRPRMYGLAGDHIPLIPRDLRWEVSERLAHDGSVLLPLDEAAVEALAEQLKAQDVEAVVVSFLHSYANAAHEERAKQILLAANPDWHVVTSSGVIREYYEFERTSTAAVQGFLEPLVARYGKGLAERLTGWGYDRDILIMQSNGGLVPIKDLSRRAAWIVRSGPAAGVMAAAELAREAGYRHLITGDMGGTSFDVAVVIDGVPEVAESTNLDFRIPLRLPMIDVHTIGAGGGSIAHIDRGGLLEVGPRSAGARPGPVAYRRGGTLPTVTDANVVLERLDPERSIAGEGQTLDLEGARAAVGSLGQQLGLGVEETAEAILAVINQRMAGRIRLLSIERGHDPRDFAFVAFGGAGPLHGAALIREVGVRSMLVPPYPGVLCAMGCALADLRIDLSQTIEKGLEGLDAAEIAGILADQRDQGLKQLAGSGVEVVASEVRHSADMAYRGQIHNLRVAIEPDWSLERIGEAFDQAYAQEFGKALAGTARRIVNLRTAVLGRRGDRARLQPGSLEPYRPEALRIRRVHFGEWMDCAVYERAQLTPGASFEGPAIVVQSDTTTAIEPGMSARVDAWGNLIVELS